MQRNVIEDLFGKAAVRSYRETYNDDGALAWVQHPHGLVLAGGENLGAVLVPAGAVDEVRVNTVDPHHCLPTSHIPQDHHVITACMDKTVTKMGNEKRLHRGPL